MKKIFIAISIAFVFQACTQQEKSIFEKPDVDKRLELISIIFRLAEKEEYSSKDFKLYTDRIEHYFEKYKNHELIHFTKSIISKSDVGYDAVISMAIHLDDNLNLLTDVKNNSLDTRWNKGEVEKFVSLLQKFAKDVEFDKFFKNNADLYSETIKRFNSVYERLDLNWYSAFYGQEPAEAFSVKIVLGNGNNNYGPYLEYANGFKKGHSILSIWRFDNEGMPVFGADEYFPILLHEYNHPYVNHFSEMYKDAFRESGEKLFLVVENEMRNLSYPSWEAMMTEALIRAAMVKYMRDHHFIQSEIENLIIEEKKKGFIWVEEFAEELENYEKQRDKYQTLESYLPRLAEVYKIWAEVYFFQDETKK
jgi:uncharacterized protein YihD (DUF1040 family)